MKFSAIGLVTTVVGAVGAYLFLAPTKSPPLVDAQGLLLDAETQAKLTEVVFQAARENDLTTIDEYLKSGFTPNVRNGRGDTLLTVAAYYDSTDVITRLLDHSETDIEARNRMGLTAIAAAAFKGHNASLQALLAHGANVNAANSTNQTAVMFAALSGRTDAVRMLLAAGADASRRDAQGNTARSLAQTQGATAVLNVLSNEMLTTSQRVE